MASYKKCGKTFTRIFTLAREDGNRFTVILHLEEARAVRRGGLGQGVCRHTRPSVPRHT